MGSAILCGHAGIEQRTIGNSAAVLKNDKKLIVTAAAQGQLASDRILNRKVGERNEVTDNSAKSAR